MKQGFKVSRILCLILSVVLAFGGMTVVFADDPWDGLVETSVLTSEVCTSSCWSGDTFSGYIMSVTGSDYLASDYIKVTYTIDSGDVTDETQIFTIQPYTSTYAGWEDNFITIGDSTLDGGVYTAYMAVSDVKSSLTEGSLYGINISFVQNSGYEATLTGYYYLAPEAEVYTYKSLLKLTLDYCAGMNESKYQADSWATFQTAVASAQSVYDSESSTDSDYQTARSSLEKVKANLLFVDSTDPGNPLDFRMLSGDDTVYEMGVGWNLGNTLDGHTGFHPSETAWQSVITTREIIKSVHDAGFNTIRVPVTWGDMIDDDNGYAINDAWISRVQDIVDYCTELDMYTIINIHHDGSEQDGWLRVAADDIDSVYEKYECVWRNIAERFKDYDEHLIFESANELTCMADSDKNSAEAQTYDTPIIMNLNQIFVNTVRSTGSNNKYRWLACVSHYANRGTGYSFALPSDSYNDTNRLMFAQHIYKNTSYTTWTYTNMQDMINVIKESANKFTNIPIILGEYGTRNKANSANPSGFNDIDRAWYDEITVRAAKIGHTVPCVWDQGWFDLTQTSDSSWTVWDRENQEPVFKTITDAMMRGMYLDATTKNKSYNMSDIEINPDIAEITSIKPSSTSVSMELGESVTLTSEIEPSDTNDVVLWKSADDTIATVTRGIIQGNKIGTTTITAFSQSGSAESEISVTVYPKTSVLPAESIALDADEYTVKVGGYTNMRAEVLPSGSDAYLTYSSSDMSVATVNRLGKIVGISAGHAYITVTASSGITKTVPVTVTEVESSDSIELALNVYYNDSNYASNEVGEPITVTGDGQYTLSFDTTTDLSSSATKAGISYLNNLTSIYIKDNDVTNGNAVVSPLDSCEIRYDSVKVDGVELTITNTDFKSAIKDSGILDTNDPINGWDGSAVSEVTTSSNHAVNFTTVTNPTKIEVVFTLQNLVFTEVIPDEVVPATSIDASSSSLVMTEGAEANVNVSLLPLDTTSNVTFVSSDQSVVMVNDTAVDSIGGTASIKLLAVGTGSAVITAMTDNGLSTEIAVTVAGMPFENAAAVIEGGIVVGAAADVEYVPSGDITVIIAVYDQDGALTGYDTVSVAASDISVGTNGLSVSGISIPISDTDTASVYIWNSLDEMQPLSK